MYRMTVTIVEVMNLYDVHATLWDTSDVTGATERISHTHTSIPGDRSPYVDPFASILNAIREWAEMTISS